MIVCVWLAVFEDLNFVIKRSSMYPLLLILDWYNFCIHFFLTLRKNQICKGQKKLFSVPGTSSWVYSKPGAVGFRRLREEDHQEFKATLCYIMSAKLAWATEQDPASIKKWKNVTYECDGKFGISYDSVTTEKLKINKKKAIILNQK